MTAGDRSSCQPFAAHSDVTVRLNLPKVRHSRHPLRGRPPVCPTAALQWEPDQPTPSVQHDLCISCGLCASRCSVGAIHLDSEGQAHVAAGHSDYIEPIEARTGQSSAEARRPFENAERRGSLREVTDETILALVERISSIGSGLPARFPTVLARNLLREAGIRALSRRIGDVNVRIDLLLRGADGRVAVGEVEFSPGALLDAPRDVLDDAAVLINRYGVERDNIDAIVVALALPNERSEFWQVISDVRQVLGLQTIETRFTQSCPRSPRFQRTVTNPTSRSVAGRGGASGSPSR